MSQNQNINNLKTGLYCVSTPIGNMGDFSTRAKEILQKSDLILCEDTRVSKKLFDRYSIRKKYISYHKFNERKKMKEIIDHLLEKKIVSIISDAGTPLISDPGKILINECIKNNIDIYPVPGPSAVTTALSISGFSDNYYFCGFLPPKIGEIKKMFKSLLSINCSIVFFVSPKKIKKYVPILIEFFEEREILICREMTKIHEEYLRLEVKSLLNLKLVEKGELTIVISEKKNSEKKLKILKESFKKRINDLIKKK